MELGNITFDSCLFGHDTEGMRVSAVTLAAEHGCPLFLIIVRARLILIQELHHTRSYLSENGSLNQLADRCWQTLYP